MGKKEELDLLCQKAKQMVKNEQSVIDYKKLWHDFALKGSVQSRKAKLCLIR